MERCDSERPGPSRRRRSPSSPVYSLRNKRLSSSTSGITPVATDQESVYEFSFTDESISPCAFWRPLEVLSKFSRDLTDFEKTEILSYHKIYYYGAGILKRPARKGLPNNNNYDDTKGVYIVTANDHIQYRYKILETIGSGKYGTVIKAFDFRKERLVAIKILKYRPNNELSNRREVSMTLFLHYNDKRKNSHLVQLHDCFKFRQHDFLVFEILHTDLKKVLLMNPFGLNEESIKTVTRSLLISLRYLAKNKVIHTDLKCANIGLKAPDDFSVKLLDFGCALFCYEASKNKIVQPLPLRAPEVILGTRFDCKIDIWSLGCVAAQLRSARHIFTGTTHQEQLSNLIEVFGLPPRSLIDKSKYGLDFFTISELGVITFTPRLLRKTEAVEPNSTTLEELIGIENDPLFIDFLSCCFAWEPDERASPEELLQHRWFAS